MAQVSIQYSLDKQVDSHDTNYIKNILDEVHGVRNVSVNKDSALVCVDYDDTGVSEKQLEKVFGSCGFNVVMIDKIMF